MTMKDYLRAFKKNGIPNNFFRLASRYFEKLLEFGKRRCILDALVVFGRFGCLSRLRRLEGDGGAFMDDYRSVFMIIDQHLLDELAAQAKASPRLRMNLSFNQCLDEKCLWLRFGE